MPGKNLLFLTPSFSKFIMKIILINETWGMSGGQERYILQVGNGLLERGYDVRLIFGKLEGEAEDTSLAKFQFDLIEGLDLEVVAKYVQEFGPDVINLQNVYDGRLITFLNQKYPVTRFVHDHTTYCPGNSKYFFNSGRICPIAVSPLCLVNAYKEKCMTRRPKTAITRVIQRKNWLKTLRALPLVLVNSNYIKERLVQNGLDGNKIIVNNLFPGHTVTTEVLDLINTDNKEKTILFVGRLFKEKGVDLLIRAVSKLSVPVKVQIVGDGWEKENLIDLAKNLGISHKVDFLGFINSQQIAVLYAKCDLFVMPSVWPEPFGMVGLEAGQFGKPVIAFNVGGISDWLVDGENGLLLKNPDVNLLVGAIGQLISNPDLSRKLGENGRNKVKNQFSLERHLKVLEESFSKLIK